MAKDKNQDKYATDPALEERVRKIMETEPKGAAKPQAPAENNPVSSGAPTAPMLDGPEPVAEPALEPLAKKKESKEVLAAIEEVNIQLLQEAKSIEVKDDNPAIRPAPTEKTDNDIPDEAPVLTDPELDKAVDDIVAHEADQLLEAEDKKIAPAPASKPSLAKRTKGFFKNLWSDPRKRRLMIIFTVALLVLSFVVPKSRYFLLNTAGVRAGASFTVLDESTRQPLKNVKVSLAGKSSQTDKEGKVQFSGLKLGATELVVARRAFAPLSRQVTIGWGSNPLGEVSLKPTGTQYSFLVTDFLSGKPVTKIEASSNDASAFSDEDGKIKLTVDDAEEDSLEVIISGSGYREELLTINSSSKDEHAVKLVPGRKHAFISKRRGKFDVYKIDIDGKNEELVLAGSGSEQEDMTLLPHPNEEMVALVSTRENKRNKDGFLLSTLTVLNLKDNSAIAASQSERIQLIGWSGKRIVYVRIVSGESASSPRRSRLISYDYETVDSKELAASNYFNDVLMIGSRIYYAPSSAYTDTAAAFSIKADGSSKQTVLNEEVWSFSRTAHDRLILSLQQEWYEYTLGGEPKLTKLSEAPANVQSRTYVDGPNGKRSLWVDERDGKGVLLAYDTSSKEDKDLVSRSGLKHPVRWLSDNSVVFRVKGSRETADYAISLDGGEAVKVRDVTDTSGLDQWYYY